jgi:hypothetical protein
VEAEPEAVLREGKVVLDLGEPALGLSACAAF